MKTINLDATLHTLEGNQMTRSDEDKDVATLGWIAAQALATDIPGDNLTTLQKVDRFMLAQKYYKGGVQEISEENIGTIKECVGKVFGIRVTGPFVQALEAARMPDEKQAV